MGIGGVIVLILIVWGLILLGPLGWAILTVLGFLGMLGLANK